MNRMGRKMQAKMTLMMTKDNLQGITLSNVCIHLDIDRKGTYACVHISHGDNLYSVHILKKYLEFFLSLANVTRAMKTSTCGKDINYKANKKKKEKKTKKELNKNKVI